MQLLHTKKMKSGFVKMSCVKVCTEWFNLFNSDSTEHKVYKDRMHLIQIQFLMAQIALFNKCSEANRHEQDTHSAFTNEYGQIKASTIQWKCNKQKITSSQPKQAMLCSFFFPVSSRKAGIPVCVCVCV